MRTRMSSHARPDLARPIQPVDPSSWITKAIDFLKNVQKLLPPGYFSISARQPISGEWKEFFFHNRRDWTKVAECLENYPRESFDLYFSVNAFAKPERKRQFCLDTCLVHADHDESDPHLHKPLPGVYWDTSPGRYQSLNIFAELRPAIGAERVTEFMVKRYGGDAGGWSCTKVLRIPFTYNHKPHYRRPLVRLIMDDFTPHEHWPRTNRRTAIIAPKVCVDPHKHDWQAVVRKYRARIATNWEANLLTDTTPYPGDRSVKIYKIVRILNEAGASPEEIGAVLWRSPYFISKYEHVRDRHDILDKELTRILGKLEGGQ